MKNISLLAIALAIAGVSATAQAEQYCREYTQTMKVGNTLQKGYGTACMQADGSWQIMTPATTQNAYVAPQPQYTTTYIVEERPVVYYVPRPRPRSVAVVDIRFGDRHHHGGHSNHHRSHYGSRW